LTEPGNNPEAPKPRKPGFFSRLFTARGVDASPDAEIPEVPVGEESPAAAPPPVEVVATAAPAAEEKKPGLFARWFGGKPAEAPHPPPDGEAAPPSPPLAAPRKSWFERLRDRLRSGSGSFIGAIRGALGLSGRLDADTLEKIEEILIASDVGMDTTLKIVERLEKRARERKAEGADAIMALLREILTEVFVGNAKPFAPQTTDGPYVVMVTGVNGVGKTTTIGKMANRCRRSGLKTMLVAGDTFRAAAIEQLEIWARRSGSEFMRSSAGADPSGLVFDALKAAQSRGIDVVFIDTAGRLQNKQGLMDELGKVARVCSKVLPGAPHEILLVLDATTGQNAISQVSAFGKAVPLTGLVMTKLDGTAKGGILITLRDKFTIPITLVGVGEGIDDLRDFDPEQFAAALFEDTGRGSRA
jgi:fused signal recognition particle receptor